MSRHAFPDPNEYAKKLRSRPQTTQSYFQMAASREKKKTSASYDVRKKVYGLKQVLAQYKREYAEVLATKSKLQAVMSNNNYN